eukprot:CCRYP_014788-RA/>CCRYP_014788-RA protein AED:0.11 eAED:0.11 QI:0/-1/0/1/-1/1/1/0/232
MKTISRGVWTANEQELFKLGCISCGWGQWTKIATSIPTRNTNQVKSHAQKFAQHHPLEKKLLELKHARTKLDEAKFFVGELETQPLRNPNSTSSVSLQKKDATDVSLGIVVESPAKFDVICALGEAYSIQHSGNRRFQVLIEENLYKYELLSSSVVSKLTYMSDTKDKEKAKLLFDDMLSLIKKFGGRFITRNKSGQWKVASDSLALRKIEATFISYGEMKAIVNINAHLAH